MFFVFGIAAYIMIGFIKNAPNIVLNKDGIYFKKNHYSWDKLSSFKLTGRGDMAFKSHKSATLIFEDNKTLKIYDNFYSNSAEMKCFLQQIIIEKKEKIEKSYIEIDSFDISQEAYTSHKRDPYYHYWNYNVEIYICFYSIAGYKIKRNSNQQRRNSNSCKHFSSIIAIVLICVGTFEILFSLATFMLIIVWL